MKFVKGLTKFFSSADGTFLLGAVIGLIFFAAQFGLALVNPTAIDWIFHGVTHDTAQHFLGWEFFRTGSSGATITGLAYPVGLPLTFMDGIPLLALPLKLIAAILPTSFQFFGLWALLCYILLGGLAAILMRKIWRKVFVKNNAAIASSAKQSKKYQLDLRDKPTNNKNRVWQILFVAAGALIFVLNPITLARTLYHPALAAQWLILLAILLIWDAQKFVKSWKFVLIWSAMLVGAVLIHPYFLPMLGAMMLIAALRTQTDFHWKKIVNLLIKVFIPVILAAITFAKIGGFALGGGAAEVYDLPDKGFNLISFLMSGGWSLVMPAILAHSGSPETMMWFGLGMWILVIVTLISSVKLLRKKFGKKWLKKFARSVKSNFIKQKTRNIWMTIVILGLLIFAIGVSLEIGPWRIFQWQPPKAIYDFWNIFRAAAREAWPFYYAAILLLIFAFSKVVQQLLQLKSSRKKLKNQSHENNDLFVKKNFAAILAVSIFAVSLVQLCDIWFSPMATTRRQGFEVARTSKPEFVAPNIRDLVTTQKHLIVLDESFRGDQSGFYELGQAALQNNLTLNIGFFARVPEQIFTEQTAWREKVLHGKLSKNDLRDNLFATKDENLVKQISQNYRIEQRGNFYFILAEI